MKSLFKNFFKTLWAESAPLTVCCILMLAAFMASGVGILIDPAIIGGMPAWLKPAKFGISTAIFAGTIAWLFQYITIWPRFKRVAGWILSIILVLEVGIVGVQAARGTTSHFNVAHTVDSVLWLIMGVSIGVLLLISVAIAYAVWRQPFADRAWGWSLRLGVSIFVLGAASGGLMVGPTAEQRQALAEHEQVMAIGGHTVGAPDGGEGIPGVGWSRHHGDLRVAHFFGLHALQIVPFLGWVVSRNRKSRRLVFTAAASYLAFVGILVWQAMRGQSIVESDARTLVVFAMLAGATAIVAIWPERKSEEHDSRTAVPSV
jgi:hypothetical protein